MVSFPAVAHEFWIEPHKYQVETDDGVIADLRNGEQFSGISLAYIDRDFTRFEIAQGEEVLAVGGRMGDRPALKVQPSHDGLLIVLHETAPNRLTYKKWQKFLSFSKHKDFAHAEAVHEERGWPKENFSESYTRHAKALVGVGSGNGTDRAYGLATEFVALTNPYAPGFDGQMRIQLNYQGMPRSNAQVEVFEKAADGSVEVTFYRTNAAGQAVVPVISGHAYLFDAVLLREHAEAGSEETAPVWETLWASLTFAVPEK